MDLKKILFDYFEISEFRDKQRETIGCLLENQNTLCLMPTGMGKSLIYQVATIAKDKMTLVISPLIALMEQQNASLNKQLNKKNIYSLAFNSKNDNVIKQYKYLTEKFNPSNNPRFLFVSPEKMMLDGYIEYVLRQNKDKIGLIVIDEAHCISQWGHSFRPAYKMIPKFLDDIFGNNKPTILCLTATINEMDKEEIIRDFNINKVIQSGNLLRDNIELHIEKQVSKNEEKNIKLTQILNQFNGEKIIVFTHIKKREYGTKEMSKTYKNLGFNCAYFDSDLKAKEKDEILENFTNGNVKIIFATNAFGMGIDISDIRCVVHYQIPENLEQYYQEVGRAGRDGKPSYAYLLHAEPNLRIKRDQINKSAITEKELIENWEIITNSKGIGFIGQWSNSDYSDNINPMIIFCKLVEKGYLKILCKSLQKIDCFDNVKNNLEFKNYISIKKYVKLISDKINEDIVKLTSRIFDLVYKKEIELNSNPSKVLFYKVVKDLNHEDVKNIITEFNLIKNFKLQGLEKLHQVLKDEISIDIALKRHLGI
ncbi:RecQ family ATP-dependent DNA helicase [Chryseobacterium nepalense]|uniref:RecQ family ATP-dependent DNA helicase n=1 Tax=Chryseobacterium nepalense TaxID=1854498 RepID=UPI002E0B9CF2|nr:ATP-dependent DNA helicase RecQ [Chryseobacterium nepalense]